MENTVNRAIISFASAMEDYDKKLSTSGINPQLDAMLSRMLRASSFTLSAAPAADIMLAPPVAAQAVTEIPNSLFGTRFPAGSFLLTPHTHEDEEDDSRPLTDAECRLRSTALSAASFLGIDVDDVVAPCIDSLDADVSHTSSSAAQEDILSSAESISPTIDADGEVASEHEECARPLSPDADYYADVESCDSLLSSDESRESVSSIDPDEFYWCSSDDDDDFYSSSSSSNDSDVYSLYGFDDKSDNDDDHSSSDDVDDYPDVESCTHFSTDTSLSTAASSDTEPEEEPEPSACDAISDEEWEELEIELLGYSPSRQSRMACGSAILCLMLGIGQ